MARRLLTLLAALLLALSLGQSSASAASFANPVKSVKGADPWIAYHDGNYHLVTTSWTDAITIRKSPTLAGLASTPSVQVWQGGAANRCCNIWAPELHFLNGRWYLYYVAGQNVSDYIPMGPYTYRNQLNSAWMLEPNVATINGRLYLFGSASGGGNNQKWRLEDLGDDTPRLVNVATGKVLDTENCSSTDGADLRQWSLLNNTCQQWRLMPV